jgi:hypothetical protein
VTWTGDGTATSSKNIPHNLGSVPACIIAKNITSSTDWAVYHQNTGIGTAARIALSLNSTSQSTGNTNVLTSDTEFNLEQTLWTYAGSNDFNVSGQTYVAYLFASDAGGFGDDGDESIIKCGNYTGNGAASNPITLGFEPQWILLKRTDIAGDWGIIDTMRGWSYDTEGVLKPNTSGATDNGNTEGNPTATGFDIGNGNYNINTRNYIYIAIRRPMKTPESGTEVFNPDLADASVAPLWEAPFPVDLGMYAKRDSSTATFYAGTRLTGTGRLSTWNTAAEVTDGSFKWDYMDGWFNNAFTDSQYLGYGFKRATGFFDVVAYTGNESTRTINHNLGVAPEMMIIKARESLFPYEAGWVVYHSAISPADSIYLSQNGSSSGASFQFASTEPTSSVFTLGSAIDVNMSGKDFISYHFATLAGVSKVGSYTGTGS